MKNFIQDGETVDMPAPVGGVASGDGVVIGALFGVASTTAAAGESVALATEGVFQLPKQLSATFATGSVVSFVAATRECAAPGSGRYPIGVAVEATSGATVRVRLNGVTTTAAT